MGLDVYLKKDLDKKGSKQREEIGDLESSVLWRKMFGDRPYNEILQVELEEYREKRDLMFEKLNLDEFGGSNTVEDIEAPSVLHPDHYFKIGYFRSSYNDGGFNRVAERHNLPTLYDIFYEGEPGQDRVSPNWEMSRTKAVDALRQAKKVFGNLETFYEVMPIYDFSKSKVSSPAEALKLFHTMKEQFDGYPKEQKEMLAWVSDGNGLFMLMHEPKVKAIILGHDDYRNVAYMVHEISGERKKEYDWYIAAYEVVLETVEYVLSQDLRQCYYLSWSA